MISVHGVCTGCKNKQAWFAKNREEPPRRCPLCGSEVKIIDPDLLDLPEVLDDSEVPYNDEEKKKLLDGCGHHRVVEWVWLEGEPSPYEEEEVLNNISDGNLWVLVSVLSFPQQGRGIHRRYYFTRNMR